MQDPAVTKCLINFSKELREQIEAYATVKDYPAKEHILRQGAYVKYLPILSKGLIRIYSMEDGVPFLLYYIKPGETCVFSFTHLFNDDPIPFSAYAEEDCQIMCLPLNKAREWLLKYPGFNSIIIGEYQRRYEDLLHTAKQFICYNLEDRLWNYLQEKAQLTSTTELKISHQAIANDLATSREVISRLTKKLEKENRIKQHSRHIEILKM